MTTFTISSGYPAGFTLSNPTYGGVLVTATGSVGAAGLVLVNAGSATNFGLIEGTAVTAHAYGLVFDVTGALANGSAAHQNATISGYGGVSFAGAGAVANYGVIEATGGAGHVAVALGGGGTLTNGSLKDVRALISGYSGVSWATAATVINFGTIEGGPDAALSSSAGGKVVNGSVTDPLALIAGYAAIDLSGVATVSNFGTIASTAGAVGAYGVDLGPGGVLTNGAATDQGARIEGYGGVELASATAMNFGTIVGEGAAQGVGVAVASGALTNGSALRANALIEGYSGVTAAGTASITNFGTINGEGGAAVVFSSSGDTLVATPSGVFVGSIVGGGGKLELTGAGVLTGLLSAGTLSDAGGSTNFTGFGTTQVDAPAAVTLAGTGAVAAGQSLIVLGTAIATGALDVSGILSGTGTLAVTGGLTHFEAGSTISVANVSQSGGNIEFGQPSVTLSDLWTQSAGTLTVLAGDRVNFKGASDSFSGTLVGAGTVGFTGGVTLLDSATLSVASVVTSAATVTLAGIIDLTKTLSVTSHALIIGGPYVNLLGAGSISLSNSAANVIRGAAGGATLINGVTIKGAGDVGAGQLTLVNGGKILGNLTNTLTIDTGAATIDNYGVIEDTGAGGVIIDCAAVESGVKGTILSAGLGGVTINGAIVGPDITTLRSTKGTLAVEGAAANVAARCYGGEITFASGFAGALYFNSNVGTIRFSQAPSSVPNVHDFSKTGTSTIDLKYMNFSTASFSFSTLQSVLTITDGVDTSKFYFLGKYSGTVWHLAADSGGGVLVTNSPTSLAAASMVTATPIAQAMAGFGAPTAGQAAIAAEPVHAYAARFLARPGTVTA
jgi:hypothetical protein